MGNIDYLWIKLVIETLRKYYLCGINISIKRFKIKMKIEEELIFTKIRK